MSKVLIFSRNFVAISRALCSLCNWHLNPLYSLSVSLTSLLFLVFCFLILSGQIFFLIFYLSFVFGTLVFVFFNIFLFCFVPILFNIIYEWCIESLDSLTPWLIHIYECEVKVATLSTGSSSVSARAISIASVAALYCCICIEEIKQVFRWLKKWKQKRIKKKNK